LAVIVQVPKQGAPWKVFAFPDNAGQPWISKRYLVPLCAFAAEPKLQGIAQYLYVLIAQRGESERTIGFGVFFVSDAYVSGLEELDYGSEDFAFRKAAPTQIALHDAADAWENLPKRA
jgi:hypothetical protein